MYQREMNIKSLELDKEKGSAAIERPSEATIKEVKEDFAGIQDINAAIIRLYKSGAPPDYKGLSQAMAEIRRRAERLRANLVLPSGNGEGPKGKNPTDAKPGRSPLLDLNDLITSFVTNPLFANPNTIDAELGAAAKHDLDCIVDLSDRISKSADKLSKMPAKPN